MENECVDFKAVKAAVSVDQVVARYGVKLRRVNNHYLRGRCPLPSHGSEKSQESFGVDTAKNAWACHSKSCCSARGGRRGGNILDLVALMESCSVREAALKLQNWFAVVSVPAGQPGPAAPSAGEPQLVSKGNQLEGDRAGETTEPNPPLTFTLKSIDPSHPYLAGRGIRKETAQLFGAGFFPGRGSMSGRLVIPIHNERGELVAYAGRSIDGSEPKYKLPAGFHKSQELFNLHRAREYSTGTVIVVEGFFDCMKLTQAGAVCVALMGCSMSVPQERQLVESFRHIIVMLDGDEAGRTGAREIAGRLVNRVFVRVVDVGDNRQPDQLETAEIEPLLASA